MLTKTINVLLIEDNPDDADLIQEFLADSTYAQFRLETAQRLAAGLERLVAGGIDVVLSDLGLPDSQGIVTVSGVVAEAPTVPLVVLTGLNDQTAGLTALQQGAQDYLVKGEIDGNVLARALQYAIQRKRIEEELKRHRDHLEELVEERTAELRRANRAYRVLSDGNQVVVRATTETELLHQVCRVIVDIGGYCLAWVGFAEQDEAQTVRPVAWAGFEEGYLETLEITWADTPRGRGPTGTAIRTGQPSWVRDILTNPNFEPWRSRALKLGYTSSLALPLIVNNQVIGALNIYAAEPDAFDTEETELLTELAGDLAYGITTLRTGIEHQRAEQAYRESMSFIETIISSANDGIIVYDPEFRFTVWNHAMEAMTGLSEPEVLGHKAFDLFPHLKEQGVDRLHEMALAGDSVSSPDTPYHVPLTGKEGWVVGRYSPLRSASGDIIGVVAIVRDVTERKQAEEVLTDRNRELALLNRVIVAATSTLDVPQVLATACRELALAFDVPQSAAALLNEEQTAATVVAEHLDPERPSAMGIALPVEGNPSMQYVLEHKRPLVVSDTAHDPRVASIRDLLKERGTGSLMILPLVVRDEVIGTIGVDAIATYEFTAPEIDLATSVAATVSQALENARLFTEEHKQRVLNEALIDTATALNSTLDLGDVLERILKNMARIVPHEAANIMLIEDGIARVVRCLGYAERGLQDATQSAQFVVADTPNMQQMFHSRQAQVIPDVQDFEGWIAEPPSHWIRSYAGAPIITDGEVIGFLNLDSETVGFFAETYVPWLQAVTDQAAVAIQNARLFDAAKRRADLLAALNQATRQMSDEGLDLEKVLQNIVSQLNEKIGIAFARIWLLDETGSELVLRASAGLYTHLDGDHSRILIDDNLHTISYVAHSRQWYVSNKFQEDDRFDQDWARNQGLVAFAGYPLERNQQLIGVLALFSKAPIDDIMLDVLGSFINQSATAFENARLYQELAAYNVFLEQAVEERTQDLRRATRRVETILNSVGDALILFRPDGPIEQANPAFEEQTGYAVHEVEFHHHSLLFDETMSKDTVEEFLAAVRAGQIWRGEMSIRRKDGIVYDASVTAAPVQIEEDRPLGSVAIIRDITEHKRAEEMLRQALEREMEVGEMRMRFLSMASHDLRTPLAVIQASTDLVSQYGDRLSDEKKRAKYDQIRTSITHMIELLDDVLTIGKVEAGQLHFNPEPVNLEAFCQKVLTDLQLSIGSEHSFDVSFHGECATLMLDPKLLRHILYNLLSNAIKYSPASNTVTFELVCDENQAVFRVKDEGIGIPQADQERLFTTFYRAGNVGSVQGTGLGLAIVKQSVELHGGTITYESEEGVGTTFTIIIPHLPQEKTADEDDPDH